jgi:hypothetical protein
MPLPTFKTAEEIPESFRPEYVEVDGQWVPKAETELATEKRKRAELLTEKREADRLRKEAEEKVAAAERAAEARAKGISEEELQKIRDAEALARKPIEEEREALKAENRKLKLTDKVQALYLANGGMQDRLEDAMKALAERTDLGDKDGIVFKDKTGTVTTDDAATFFEKHKLEKPWFYAGSGASGSGASGSNGSGGGSNDGQRAPNDAQLAQKRSAVAGAF